ncbi:uncharacterized protein EMH_0089970 [Eimeria mitis]|uniref:Uncharacterized protein n=1 Tax=Eimeria mitis TaxID=44415 RepID=U6KC86_9EIME|nr:uncharacterized protein EMH_0089970 [Eimeria mitis]CDJ34391.1 hypothetical protein EMH_0089970 [Eimeria mitis]
MSASSGNLRPATARVSAAAIAPAAAPLLALQAAEAAVRLAWDPPRLSNVSEIFPVASPPGFDGGKTERQ